MLCHSLQDIMHNIYREIFTCIEFCKEFRMQERITPITQGRLEFVSIFWQCSAWSAWVCKTIMGESSLNSVLKSYFSARQKWQQYLALNDKKKTKQTVKIKAVSCNWDNSSIHWLIIQGDPNSIALQYFNILHKWIKYFRKAICFYFLGMK